ncbi:MAG TPA: acetyl-CoA carboxylase carboxyl transferase subunit alpha [Deltaproteobacteria bacterium]|nr:acetyl-CoA carboxylase carboxyl transferase subunit alpha [Deltaproteobacteria bacterium]
MKRDDRFDEIDSALKELQKSISRLEEVDTEEITRKVEQFREEIYSGISRWSSVELARHVERPVFDDYIKAVFTDFLEIHGDRIYEDDAAVKGGFAFLDDIPVMVIGHMKRSGNHKDYVKHHYGMASPSGHYKAMRLLRMAEKFKRPVITFVDTPGAYPLPEAEYKGQAFSIAQCISVIACLRTPVVVCIIGEAGSGGALALGFGDRIIMLENAFYSSISPEGYSSIIYGDAANKEIAADTLRGTGRDLYKEGIVDCLIQEPTGGAHNDPEMVVEETSRMIRKYVRELLGQDIDKIVKDRAATIERMVPHI